MIQNIKYESRFTHVSFRNILDKIEKIDKDLLKKVYGLIVIKVTTDIYYIDNKKGDSIKVLINFLNKNYETLEKGLPLEINFIDLKLDDRFIQSNQMVEVAKKWGKKRFPDANFYVDYESDNFMQISFEKPPEEYKSWMELGILKTEIPLEDAKKIIKIILKKNQKIISIN